MKEEVTSFDLLFSSNYIIVMVNRITAGEEASI